MSTRTSLRPTTVIAAGDMSTATIASTPTILQSLTKVCYTASWTGTTPIGTLAVQVSNDYSLDSTGQVLTAGTWTAIDLESGGSVVQSVPVTGNTGHGAIIVSDLAAYAVRLLYTKTSGIGTLTAIVAGKVS